MGIYINPTYGQDKLTWISKRAEQVESLNLEDKRFHDRTHIPIILISNPMFVALLVAWCKSEVLRGLPRIDDGRPRRYFVLPIELLTEEAGLSPREIKCCKEEAFEQ